MRVFLLLDRLWSPSRACDSTPGNCTLLLDALTVASEFPCVVPSSTLPVAPLPDCVAPGPPTRLSRSSSCCGVGVRPSILARSSRRLLLSTMLTLQHSNPEREEKTGKEKKNQLDDSLTSLAGVTCQPRSSSARAGPRPLATYFWLFAAPTTPRFTPVYSCLLVSDLSIFLTIIRGLHFFYDTPYPTSCTLPWKPRDFLSSAVLSFYPLPPNTRLPQRQPSSFRRLSSSNQLQGARQVRSNRKLIVSYV